MFFCAEFAQKSKGVMGHVQNGKQCFHEINNESRSSAFRKFLFYQTYVLTELAI